MQVGWIWVKQGFAEVGALAVRAPRRRDVAAHRVGGQEEDVAVAAAGEHDGVGEVGLDLTGHHVAHDDAAGPAVDDDQFEHLVPGVHLQPALGDLPLQCLVRADQQLLPGLAARVEGPRHLHAAERAVVEQAAVLAGEGDALRDALVDDVRADLGQPVDVGLARAEVAALHGVVEQPVDRVAVGLVVLRRVDAALRRDGVRATRASPGSRTRSPGTRPRRGSLRRTRRPGRCPTMMTLSLRRFAGLTSLASNLRRFHRSPIGPGGALVSAIG